ncbi:conserved hypothetical protein [Streptomyces misionensis JCM 4497]
MEHGLKRLLEVRVPEGETRLQQGRRDHARAVGDARGELAQRGAQREGGDGGEGRAVQGAAQRLRRRPVRQRMRRREVDRPGQRPGAEGEPQGGDLVGQRDERPVLVAGAEPPAQTQAEQRQHPSEGTAPGGDHQTGARVHHPDARLPGRAGGGLPLDADGGQEVGSGRSALVRDPLAGVAVVAGRGRRHQHPRGHGRGGAGPGDRMGAAHPAVPDLPPVRGRPPPVPDARPGQVHHRVRAVQRPLRDHAPGGIPARRLAAVARRVGRGGAHEPDDLMAVVQQRADEGGTDESGGPGDHDAHGVLQGRASGRRGGTAVRTGRGGRGGRGKAGGGQGVPGTSFVPPYHTPLGHARPTPARPCPDTFSPGDRGVGYELFGLTFSLRRVHGSAGASCPDPTRRPRSRRRGLRRTRLRGGHHRRDPQPGRRHQGRPVLPLRLQGGPRPGRAPGTDLDGVPRPPRTEAPGMGGRGYDAGRPAAPRTPAAGRRPAVGRPAGPERLRQRLARLGRVHRHPAGGGQVQGRGAGARGARGVRAGLPRRLDGSAAGLPGAGRLGRSGRAHGGALRPPAPGHRRPVRPGPARHRPGPGRPGDRRGARSVPHRPRRNAGLIPAQPKGRHIGVGRG